jgi:hypothetical protein
MFQGYLINCAGLKEELKEAPGKMDGLREKKI